MMLKHKKKKQTPVTRFAWLFYKLEHFFKSEGRFFDQLAIDANNVSAVEKHPLVAELKRITYCRVPEGRGLQKTAISPGCDEARSINPWNEKDGPILDLLEGRVSLACHNINSVMFNYSAIRGHFSNQCQYTFIIRGHLIRKSTFIFEWWPRYKIKKTNMSGGLLFGVLSIINWAWVLSMS